MASQQKLKEEILTCIVCHEVFRDPVTLHCGHTFCTQCVTAYTKTHKQAIDKKSIPCPHCCGLAKVPDPIRPKDEWAGQIKTGFFVKCLLESFTDTPNDVDACIPCHKDGETTPAAVWCNECGHGLCSGCEKYHKRFFSGNHEIIQITNDNRQSMRFRKNFTCPKHPDAVIDMMCEDCDVAVCHRCCILHHRKCESVITLEECLSKLRSVIESQEKELETVVKGVTEELSSKKTQLKDVEKEAEDAITAINVSGEKIMAEVRAQQKQLIAKVKQAKHQVVLNLTEGIKFGEMMLEEVKERRGLIKESVKSDIIMNYYEMYKICKSSFVGATKEPTKKDCMCIQIEDDSDETVSHIRDKTFACLSSSDQSSSPIGIGSASKPTLVKKMDTGLKNIWDILVMTVNGTKAVIVTSWNGKCMTSFYQCQDKKCHSRLDLTGFPHGVTKISKNRCAVALNSTDQIDFLLVTPDLKRERTVRTCKGYFGLTCLSSSTFAASTGTGHTIDIIDMTGTVLRSFGLANDAAHLTSISGNIIVVPDFDNDTVKGITDTEVIKFTYSQASAENLHTPRGVSHSRCGDIFVAYEDSHKVIQLTDTGQYVRDVLSATDGIKQPIALFVDDDNLLYVSVSGDTIHVYEFR